MTRAMAREVTLVWLLPRIQDTIIAQDLMQIDVLMGLALDHGVALPPTLVEDISALNIAASGLIARATACSACAVDITTCSTVFQMGACALPFELTPAGDLNALRRAAGDYLAGDNIDELDFGLAIIGLGATGAVIASGGTSYTIKASTSVLRMARRLGTLTAPLTTRLSSLIGDAVQWDRMGDLAALRIGPADVVDSAKLAELGELSGSLRRVADKTSVAEAILLLRHVDTAQEAARLARVSDALGPRTRGAFEVLGNARVFSAAVHISNLAIGATAAIYLLALQSLIFTSQQCANGCVRATRRFLR
ncbi:hypothetical protein [Octadecabacter antarcticus]|nr:hypothetical protein [Octadecabacter antarcticus]